jgi:uncharacterized membrane protein
MSRNTRRILGTVFTAATIAVIPALAQYTEHVPTQKDPLRFTAFAVQMEAGISGAVDIAIERWSTDAERQQLVGMVQATNPDNYRQQEKLVKALQDVKPRVGFIRTPNSMGWDLRYAYESKLPDGSRQIVIATDKPISFGAAASQAQSTDYAFTLIQMQFPAGKNKGEGKMLAQSSIGVKNGKLEIETYGQEPVRFTEVTEAKDKKKN